jgi:signal transduction histidine kinase
MSLVKSDACQDNVDGIAGDSTSGDRDTADFDTCTALLRHIPDVIFGWHIRPDGTQQISFHGTAANYVGAAPTGSGPAGLPLHPDDQPRWQQALARSAGSAASWSFEGRYLPLTGAARWFECHVLARDDKGVRAGVVLDSTRRKAAETAERQVKESRAELTQLKHMASLGQLTAGIVHEIKNPLNFISNFAALSIDLLDELFDHVANDDRAQIEEASALLATNLGKIRDHAGRVDGIIRSMLLHAHTGAGVRRPADLNRLVEEARSLAFYGARAKDMSFQCACDTRFDPTVGIVDIVPEDMTRVFVNLLSNAFYATEKRRQHKSGTDYMPAVEVSTRRSGDTVEIRVDDNGVGIPDAARQLLFTPFFTTKPSGEGTGLGLSLSADIVREHGGQIRCESGEDGHTVFTITLPAPRRQVVEARPFGARETVRPR